MTTSKKTDEVRLLACVSEMGDMAAIYNAFTGGVGHFRLSAQANSLYEVVQKMREQDAQVLLIDQGMLRGDAARQHLAAILTELIDTPAYPRVCIGIFQDPEWQLVFEKSGAYGTLRGPLNQLSMEELRELIATALYKAQLERQGKGYVDNHMDPGLVRLLEGKGLHHQNIAVWGPKGGTCKSSTAVSLAYALGELGQEPTLLVETDMNAADCAGYCGIQPEARNLATLANEWMANGQRLDKSMARKNIVRVKGRFDMLCGVHDMTLTGSDPLRSEAFAQALYSTVTSLDYSFVIFDLGQSFYEPLHFVPLTRASRVLVMVTNEASSVRELVPALNGLRQALPGEVDPVKYRLVFNKWTSDCTMDRGDVQKLTGLPEAGCIPYGDYAAITNRLNRGLPLVTEHNPVGNALLSLASSFHPGLQQILDRRLGKRSGGFNPLGLFGRKAVANA